MNINDMIDEVCKSLIDSPESWVAYGMIDVGVVYTKYVHSSGLVMHRCTESDNTDNIGIVTIKSIPVTSDKLTYSLLSFEKYAQKIHDSEEVAKELDNFVNFNSSPEKAVQDTSVKQPFLRPIKKKNRKASLLVPILSFIPIVSILIYLLYTKYYFGI